MRNKGGNGYITYPLSGIHSLGEKTICHSWDGEDTATGGRQGCWSFMRLVGIRHVVHDHVLIRLRCSAEGCGREVTISNREKERRRYTDLPASIKQKSFSPYILMLALFSLAAACRTAHQQRMWELQLSRTMSKSTFFAHQRVVWHFVNVAFDAEMERQRKRQEETVAALVAKYPNKGSALAGTGHRWGLGAHGILLEAVYIRGAGCESGLAHHRPRDGGAARGEAETVGDHGPPSCT